MPNDHLTSINSTCNCIYCQGQNGKRLISVTFEMAEAAGLIDAAKKNRVTIKRSDQIFVIQGIRAACCVRFIRRKLARLCGCWVDKEARKSGWGEMMVRHRIAFIEHHTSAVAMDTYAFNSRLYKILGFEPRQGYKIGTTLLRKVIDR